jgi:predicted nucleic acid-binding protein
VISELALVELYVLLRNPAVVERPLTADAAAARIDVFRQHPRWRLVDHDPEVMDELWRRAAGEGFARGRVFDARLALGLIRHGVTHFATRNTKHFEGFGFDVVWGPLRP